MKFKAKIPLGKAIALTVGILLVWGFLHSQRVHSPEIRTASAGGAPLKAGVGISRKFEIPILAEAVGTVRSRRQTEIAARVLAEVREMRRQPGDEVAAGEVLIILDSRDLKARVEQAQANLKSRQEALQEARTEFERTKNLLAKEASTQQQMDIARFRLAGAEAQEIAAQKALEEAQITLGYAEIRAPFPGLIFEKRTDPGDLAAPGKPLLGLYDPKQLRLEVLVEERLLWILKVKDVIEITIEALGRPIQGQVSEVVPAVDPSTRTGIVKIDLPDSGDLKPGMFGRARIPMGKRAAVAVPRAALVRRGQLEMVFVPGEPLFGRGAFRVARMVLVRSGEPIPDAAAGGAGAAAGTELVEILGGLEAGREILLAGGAALRDGDPIEASAQEKKQ